MLGELYKSPSRKETIYAGPAAAAKSLRSCPTLCDPIDGSPLGFPVPGILQARTLEWVAVSFSSAWKWEVKVKLLNRVWLFTTPWTAAYQAPLSMGFSRQKYWSGVPLGCYKFWLFRSICIIRPLPSSGKIMLPLTNEVVHFEKLKLVFQATWRSVYLSSYPLLHILLTVKDWKSFHIYLYSFYFPTETFHFSEIPNKYLLKSVSRWIFCLLIIILSYVQ